MRRVASLCALVFAVNIAACDDDETTKPDTVDTTADVVPDAVDTAPEVEDAAPEVEDAAPDAVDTAPEVEDAAPEVGDAAPEVEDTAPEVEDAAPEVEDAAPEVDDTTADTDDAEDTDADVSDGADDAQADADAGLPGDTPQPVLSQGWLVAAEMPVLSEAGDTVIGAVTFTRQSGAETRGGGVCLVADLHDATPCETRDDCVAMLPTFSEDYFLGGFYYCASLNGAGPKRCWTRPGGVGYCFRGSAHVPGTYTTPAMPALVDGAPTLWTSYACMADEENSTGCAGTQNVSTTGPTLLVSP